MFSLSLENILVVTELISRGSLLSLLRSRHVPDEYTNLTCVLNDRELLSIAWQIASGMQYLEEIGVGVKYNICVGICFNDLT